ncbi:DUF3429 domain-containing protein [Mameliella sediminis]|uniref:DUF3429 domain-containing protein n=1 Tax=Mameliella sediminis TaxID=2836866 RepID=UPI001C45B50D|nr:DUF3429 domain-containing protein [Mameliella sediminis]MBV7394390.1 DUF3429 domain-containing protein [Mameliella sediminis]MBY6162625.1 DUF3429 domain-containing protein [Mameliella alba]MBY6172350.1 DUF3429 domain-containing protein [Mameliella alba]MBY6176112.1 DUF3429 domain-containing protein [Mameliella alba]
MTQIPRSALLLGLAGVLPFVWGLATLLIPGLHDGAIGVMGPRFVGPYVQLFYGAVILSFMSGVLWGFATKAEGRQATTGYALSVLPALWAFFTTGGGEGAAAMNLSFGFLGLLLLDLAFWRWGLAPPWWMSLRVLLTALVVPCLLVTALL